MFRNVPVFTSLGLLAGLVPAQGPVSSAGATPAPAPSSIIRAAHGLGIVNGRLAGGGADYKVHFDHGGVELTPALGRQAPKNYPLRYALTAIERGKQTIVHGAAGVAPAQQGQVAMYDRGHGITERFEVRPDGVELSYVFSQPLGGDGDLVVRGQLTTELVSTSAPAGELRFAGAFGGVKIGKVTGIDARGAQVAGAICIRGSELELSLPDAFVDQAAYPLVLDPLIGADFSVGVGWDDIDADVAFDLTSGNYLVVWQREFSGSNIDIRGQLVDTTGALVGTFIAIASPTNVAMRPTVASVNLTDRFLVAWQESASVLGPWDILAATLDPATRAVSATANIAATAVSEFDPDAGSEATVADDEAIVVWEQTSGQIFAAQVTVPAVGAPIPFAAVALSGGVGPSHPAISKSGGPTGRFLVTWNDVVFPATIVRAAVISRNVGVLDSIILGVGSEPDADGNGTDFVVAFERQEPLSTVNSDIYCRSVHFDAATNTLSLPGGDTVVENDGNDDERLPAVGLLGVKYAVAWADASGVLNYDINVKEFDANCTICSTQHTVVGTGVYDTGPEIGTQLAGGGAGDQALLSFSSANNTPPFDSDVQAQLIEALGAGGALVDQGGGCGGGGTVGNTGVFAIGNPNFRFNLTGASLAASGAVFNINGPVPPIVCGACQVTPPLVTIGTPIVGGAASAAVPLPCNLGLVGGTVQVQWYVVAPLSPCVLAPGVSFSNRLNATVGT